MITTKQALLAVLASAPSLFAQYSYYYTDSLTSINTSNWTQNGTLSATSGGLTSSNADGGSLISKVAVPDGTSNYEVKTTLTLTQSGGTYVTYLRASSNAMSGPAAAGTTYAFEVQNPTFSGSACSATLAAYKIIGGSVTEMGSTTIPCSNGMTLRTVYNGNGSQLAVWVNNGLYWYSADSSITSGQPGIGVRDAPSGNAIAQVQFGTIYQGEPSGVSQSNMGISTLPAEIDFQWHGISEPNGPGIGEYGFVRDGNWLGSVPYDGQAFSDLGLTPSTSYTYAFGAIDFHMNSVYITVSEQTAPAGAISPEATGVRPTGTYWGGSGENIDVRSGNLSYSLPLLGPQQRGGKSVTFSLSYNSQNWRQDSGGAWNLGADVGYGYGWKLQAGSLFPVFGLGSISEYIFVDSTGAEYHLNQNNGGVWSSSESIYVWYNANTNTLYFRDGSFWVFGCTSAGTEQDAGTMYPTTMEDTNGNQILITYQDGIDVTWGNSSARISTIADVRAGAGKTYSFTYNSDPIPHLTSITNYIQTGEAYTFSYAENQSLSSPISGGSFGTTTFLGSSTVTNLNATNVFTYDGSGELTQVTLPYGAYLAYSYGTTTYSSTGISQREVTDRYLSPNGTQTSQLTYPLSHEPNPAGPTHQYSILTDPSGVGQKYWTFSTSGSTIGLATQYQGQQLPGPVTKTQSTFTWTQDANGNNYIASTTTALDPGQSYSATKETTQTSDNYGNVTQVQNYNYGTPGSGSAGSLARTYNYTYLNSSSYTSRYIFNRLTGASVTVGTTNTTLATNYYDNDGCSGLQYSQNQPSYEWDTSYVNISTRGDLTCSTTSSGTAAYIYDMSGNVLTAKVNNVTTQVSTPSSNNYAAPTQLTVGSLSSNLSWSSFLGLTNDTAPNGDSGSIFYDQYARKQNLATPFGVGTAYQYSSFTDPPSTGQTEADITVDNINISYPYYTTSSGRWTKKTFDGLGRTILTQSGDQSGNIYSQAESIYGPCACSPDGKLMQQAMPHTVGATPAYTVYSYDGIGRTTSVVSPDGASTTMYSYQGNTVTVTDPAGSWKTFTMDALGNLTQVVEPNPAAPTTSTYTTTYTYDAWNNLASVSMPRPTGTQTRTFVYSGPYLQSATNPENGTVTYTYNSYMKVATKTDAKRQVVVYTYDGYARLTEVQKYPNGTNNPEDTTQRETYYYDTNPFDSTYSNYSLGRLTAVQYYGPDAYGTAGATTFTEMYNYNEAGGKIGKDLRVQRTFPYYYNNGGSEGETTSYVDLNGVYSFDDEGRITGIQYPLSGPNLTWTFDSMGRLNGMSDGSYPGDIISGATYGPSNEMLTMTGTYTSSDISETRAYNTMLQLTGLVSSVIGKSVNMTYTYSSNQNNGKITSQTDNISGEQVVYTYDVLNRLATAEATSNSWGQSYSYDGFGNLTAQNVIAGSAPTFSATPNPATNQIWYSDANGNTTSVASPLTYDVSNRLVSGAGDLQQGSYQYAYAPGNKRVWRGVCCGQDPDGNLDMSTDEVAYWSITGQKLATYQLSGYGIVEEADNPPPLTATQTGTWYYFGSKMIKNAGGYAVADRLGSIGHFYPYGQEKPSATTNGTEKFTGYLRDAETAMDYAINRYHVPGTGRFLTPDRFLGSARITSPGTWNRYTYVNGDPINRTDKTGLDDICDGTDDDDLKDCDIGAGDDGGDGGDGGMYGGGGGDDGGCWIDDFEPNPECYDPAPPQNPTTAPAPTPPQLTCSFSAFTGSAAPVAGTYANGTAQIAGYGLPTSFTFSAQGGTGSYMWTETQSVTRYLKSPTDAIRLLHRGPDTPLYWSASGSTTPPTTSSASVFDAPTTVSYPAGNTITWLFNLQVTVSSGGQTVNCPDVLWNAQISFNSSGGVSGSSWSVTQPIQ